jgi:hypothetical protein
MTEQELLYLLLTGCASVAIAGLVAWIVDLWIN